MSLHGRTALITGAARGIGLATARLLCEQGMAVAINDRNADETEAAALLLRGDGHTAFAVPGDVTRKSDVTQMIARTEAELGVLWLLVCNAGTFHAGATVDLSEEDWDSTFAVDSKAVFLCSQAVLPGMIERHGGRIIIVSSIAGWIARTDQIAYCAAKASAIHFARCLSVEVASHGITVNCICPGMTDSAMLRQTAASRGVDVADYIAMIPSGRLAQPEEHGATISWLASDVAQHLTGQVISIDGGQSLYHPLTRG